MLTLNFHPFPELHTKRLVLKALEHKDSKALAVIRSNSRVNEFLDRPKVITIQDASRYIEKINWETTQNECIVWGIHFKDQTDMLGSICYWNIIPETDTAEIGYEMHPDYYGKGIMYEAMQAVIQYAFNIMKLHAIVAFPVKDNIKSIQLLERNGFTRDFDIDKYQLTEKERKVTAVYFKRLTTP